MVTMVTMIYESGIDIVAQPTAGLESGQNLPNGRCFGQGCSSFWGHMNGGDWLHLMLHCLFEEPLLTV